MAPETQQVAIARDNQVCIRRNSSGNDLIIVRVGFDHMWNSMWRYQFDSIAVIAKHFMSRTLKQSKPSRKHRP